MLSQCVRFSEMLLLVLSVAGLGGGGGRQGAAGIWHRML